ncbi:MAG TPA: creatininase family protein [Desulfopila sp.]|nr:creatininase family protein [Desulfopila sp.]
MPKLLENMSFPEVEDYLKEKDTVLVPVGSVEQHSEYGIIGTDFIAAEGVAREVGQKMGLMVAPTINYGVSPHHMDFAGSVTLSPTTFLHLIVDICRSFIRHGFSRIFFINGHGGNKNALATAFQQVKMDGGRGQLELFSWYDGLKETEMVSELFQDQDGSHATPSEISLTMLLRPSAFAKRAFEKKQNETSEYYWPLTAEEMRDAFPDGRMGASSWLASVEKGRLVMGVAVETLIEKIDDRRSVPLL